MYSYSRLGTYDTCPLQYKYRYLDRIYRPVEGIEAFLGNRVHEQLRRLYSDAAMGKVWGLEEILEAYERRWDRLYHDEIRIVRKEYGPEHYRQVGHRCLADYYRRHVPFDAGRNLGCEIKVFVTLSPEPVHRMVGYIDRLVEREPGVYEIHDYKTGQSLPDPTDLERDDQLAIYQIGLAQRFGDVRRVDLVWHFLAHDKELRSCRDEAALQQVRDRTLARIDRLEALGAGGEYPPRESALCLWCDYRDLCPLWKHRVKLDTLAASGLDQEAGAELVRRYAQALRQERELSAQRRELELAIEDRLEHEGATRLFGADYYVEIEGAPEARSYKLRRLGDGGQLTLF